MLLVASLQIHLFLPLLRFVEALVRLLLLVCGGVSVHNNHVMNTVGPLLLEVPDKKASLLLHDLWLFCMTAVAVDPAGAAFVLFTAQPE